MALLRFNQLFSPTLIIIIYSFQKWKVPTKQQISCLKQFLRRRFDKHIALHGHVAVWAAVPECAPLLLEGDEVPYGHHGVVRHVEVEQFHTGEGVESIQLTRRTGEVFGHKKAICGEQSQMKLSLNTGEDDHDE